MEPAVHRGTGRPVPRVGRLSATFGEERKLGTGELRQGPCASGSGRRPVARRAGSIGGESPSCVLVRCFVTFRCLRFRFFVTWMSKFYMDAIIYAAGRATRLGPAFAHQPKILTEVGGQTLLERHVVRLSAAGIRRVVVVTGHCREQIAQSLPALSSAHGIEVVERYNPDFGEGSVISMLCSFPDLEAAGDSILLMDGDVLYGPDMLPRLITSRHSTALLVDFAYSTADDDPVLVPVREGKPFEFRKQWVGLADRVGESVGFFKVAAGDVPLLMQETRSRSVGRARLDSMDEVLRALVRAGRFGFEDITGMPWTEIDFPSDVQFAREEVLPRIAAMVGRA